MDEPGVNEPLAAPPAIVTVTVAPLRSGSVTTRALKGATVALSATAWFATAPVMAVGSCTEVTVTGAVPIWFAGVTFVVILM